MEKLSALYDDHPAAVTVASGILAASVGIVVYRWLTRRKSTDVRKEYPRDTVIMHHIGRGPYAPSNIPFAVKLETYLRMAKIPYECDNSFKKSSKQKYPWISYNGEDIADSAFCIQFLNKHLNIDLNSWLTTEQRAVAVAFQRLVEDDLYWVLLLTRWVTEVDAEYMKQIIDLPFPNLFVKLFLTPKLKKMAYAQGMGRHSPEEVKQITRKDLTALSNYLGKKKFLMGDQPCEEDCAVFGQLSQIYWHLPSTVSTLFKEEYPSLVAYCERMKDTFWPDWVECTTQGGTVKATR